MNDVLPFFPPDSQKTLTRSYSGNSDKVPRIALVGLAGYATFYLKALQQPQRPYQLVAGIDPFIADPKHSARRMLAELQAPYYSSLKEFLAVDHADLVILCTPIHLHAEQVSLVLASGASVLCEKPTAALIQDVDAMQAAADLAPGFCAIGFQWSYANAIQCLKRDIIAGRWGAARRCRTLVAWPRPQAYYQRNKWAGRLKDSNGAWVLDSPIANATSHFLHNCWYILGKNQTSSATPIDLQAECYRANPIETFDAAALHARTADGVDVHFYTAHCIDQQHDVEWSYEFDEGTVSYSANPHHVNSGRILGQLKNGQTVDYGDPDENPSQKIWHCLDAVTEKNATIACSPAATRAHVLCVNGIHTAQPQASELPAVERIPYEDNELIYSPDLLNDWQHCYSVGCQPSDLPGKTAYRSGNWLNLADLTAYPVL